MNITKEQKPNGRFKMLGVLAAANDYVLLRELASLAGYSEMYCKVVLDKFWRSGYVEKIARERYRGNLWRITDIGIQEYRKLADMFGVVPVEKQSATSVVRTEAQRKYLSRQKRREQTVAEVKTAEEIAIIESFKIDRELRAGKRGIERYFLYDLSNPIDAEIVRRVPDNIQEEHHCRYILCKRLALGNYISYHGVDQMIENKLLQRCLQRGITRNELVRELFCIQFNIKGYEVLHAIRV